jgi:Bacterial PH domain
MREQERFRWSLWPIVTGWFFALWIGWHGISDLSLLLRDAYPHRGFVFGFLTRWPLNFQITLAVAQIFAAMLAVPSFISFISRRTLLIIGATGITFDRWIGWRRIAWPDIIRLEFFMGDAVFHLRESGKLTTLRFRPWTIGLDIDGFRDLVERHQPRLTPDEDDGQPWGRSSSFNP